MTVTVCSNASYCRCFSSPFPQKTNKPSWLKRAVLHIQLPKKPWRTVHDHLWSWRDRPTPSIYAENRKELIDTLLAALSDGHRWPKQLQKEFRRHFPHFELGTFQALFREVLSTGLRNKKPLRPENLQKLFGQKQLEQLLQQFDDTAGTAQEVAKEIHSLLSTPSSTPSPPKPNAWKKFFQSMQERIVLILNTFLKTLDFYESAKSPYTLWGKSALFDIYCKLFYIPVALVIFLAPLGLVAWQMYVGIFLFLSTVCAGLFVYQKWLRPCPTRLQGCENLTGQAQNGELSASIHQKETIDKIVRYCQSPRTGKQHILLVGRTGIGKTTAVEGAVRHLPRQQVFQINTTDFIRPNSLRDEGYGTRLEQIRQEIRGKEDKVVFFFDEFQALLSEEGEKFACSLNSHLNPQGIKCIAALTDKDYEKMRNIESYKALLNRFTKIEVEELGAEDVNTLLEMTWAQEAPDIPVDTSLWDAIKERTACKKGNGVVGWELREAKTLIHEIATHYRKGWEQPAPPQELTEKKIQYNKKRLERKREIECSPTAIHEKEGKEKKQEMVVLRKEIEKLEKEYADAQERAHDLTRVRTLFHQWQKAWKEAAKQAMGNRAKEPDLFLLYHVLLQPALCQLLEEKKQEFPSKAIPRRVDATFFNTHIPQKPDLPLSS